MQEGQQARRVSISELKRNFVRKFPSHQLSRILSTEPDSLTVEELLAKAQTWLAFFKGEDENE
ncbi:hypothetical protein SE19_02780 [Acidiplasma aeolicum]|uniref:Uncharacterized protein n=1 Tax=Acidiplasma aeolicum TaxID=507754 RepID=A0A0Q0XI68_9ARCH|nr:hypothetical protein [Acidiplasma aeolicum]KPV47038.1 hypothetical protein SE19_02780 [Acidiplasma aeolicum]KQB34394.1 hypothetical protein AOG54_01030 [Acidiplasma aeolicum]